VQAVVPEGEEPAIGAEAWVLPQPQRALVYRVTDGLLVSRAPDESPGAGAAPEAGSATEVASA
jgi:hypothetical protein